MECILKKFFIFSLISFLDNCTPYNSFNTSLYACNTTLLNIISLNSFNEYNPLLLFSLNNLQLLNTELFTNKLYSLVFLKFSWTFFKPSFPSSDNFFSSDNKENKVFPKNFLKIALT